MEFSISNYYSPFELICKYETRKIGHGKITQVYSSPDFCLSLFKQFVKEIKFRYIDTEHKEYVLNLIDANEVPIYHDPHVMYIKLRNKRKHGNPVEICILADKEYINSKYCILIALVSYIRTTGFTNTSQFKVLNKFLVNEQIYKRMLYLY
jgi:hypothetical protein